MLKRLSLRDIRTSLGRFFAIAAIIALGVGLFAGLRVSKTAMVTTGNQYLSDFQLYDFRLISTLGFTEEDVAAFSQLDGIRTAEGSYFQDALYVTEDGSDNVIAMHSITDSVNTLDLIAGRMPENANECVVDAEVFSAEDLGTTLTLSPSNSEDTMEFFAYDTYTIVGIVDSPLYINFERGTTSLGSGVVACFGYLLPEGFHSDYYLELYLCFDEQADIYSEEYDALVDQYTDPVEDLLEERAELRYTSILDDGQQELDDGQKELDDALQDLEDGETEYADGKQKLADGEADYATGVQTYEENLAQYEDGRDQYEAGLSDYTQGLAEYADGMEQYRDGKAQYDAGLAQYNDGLAQYEAGKQQFDAQLAAQGTTLEALEATVAANAASVEAVRGPVNTLLTSLVAQLPTDSGISTGDQLIAALKSGQSPELTATVDAALAQSGNSALSNSTALIAAYEQIALYDQAAAALEAHEELERSRILLEQTQAQLAETSAQLDASRIQLEDVKRQLDAAKTQLDATEAELNAGWTELEDGRIQLEESRQELDDGWSELEDARQELDDGWADYYDGVQELDDGQKELEDLEPANCYVLGRDTNVGYVCFENDTNIVSSVAGVFPVFFFLVAALVCITTMTRMVEDDRTHIGILKALGYSSGSIMGKYLFYSGSASLIGCVLGFLGGSWLFPEVMWKVYGIMYSFTYPIAFVLDWQLAVFSVGLYLFCALGSTWLVCRSSLKEVAAELIRPKAPKNGKRILLERVTFLWKRMSFLYKVSARNIFRYKKRLFMMILGIGGSTALLLTGFGINDSIANVVDFQFNEISHYDSSVTFQNSMDPDDQQAFLEDCSDVIADAVFFHGGTVDASRNGVTKSVNLVVSDASVGDFMDFHCRNEPVAYPGEGEVLINNGLADTLDVEIGDTITLRDSDMNTLELTVSGIFDNYIYNYVFLTPETAEGHLTGADEIKSAYIIDREDVDTHVVAARIIDQPNVASVSINADMQARVNAMLDSLNYVVLLVILCAASLAFIVLYNLTNININERIREIATIKVLGFYPGETASYVFRENVVLTGMGAIIGLILGRLLHAYVMVQIRIDMMHFDVRIAGLSYVLAVVLTFFFAAAINWIMYYRLKRINMAESLKSIE